MAYFESLPLFHYAGVNETWKVNSKKQKLISNLKRRGEKEPKPDKVKIHRNTLIKKYLVITGTN